MANDDYAVVVGINTYPNLGNLQGPRDDALDFYDWLYAGEGGNVPDANISVIVSPQYANAPALAQVAPRIHQIESVFENLALQFKQHGQQAGRLYLYLAGHGFSKEVNEAAVLMAHAVKGVTTNMHIAGSAYANSLAKTSWFREVVLLMDCCREDFKMTGPRAPVIDNISGNAPAEWLHGFATTWSRSSREGPWGNQQKVRGIFTLALLAGLRGGAKRDENGQVSREHLSAYVHEYVKKSESMLPAGQKAQSPKFSPSDDNYPWKFNALPGEQAINPPRPPSAEQARPPNHYTVQVAAGNGNAGKTFKMQILQQEYPLAAQTPNAWIWHLAQGYYKLIRSDGASTFVEVTGAEDTIHVQL